MCHLVRIDKRKQNISHRKEQKKRKDEYVVMFRGQKTNESQIGDQFEIHNNNAKKRKH